MSPGLQISRSCFETQSFLITHPKFCVVSLVITLDYTHLKDNPSISLTNTFVCFQFTKQTREPVKNDVAFRISMRNSFFEFD